MFIVKDLDFDEGVIELEIKGENSSGKILLDSSLKFKTTVHEKRFIKTNYKVQYGCGFPCQPLPDRCFRVKVKLMIQKYAFKTFF